MTGEEIGERCGADPVGTGPADNPQTVPERREIREIIWALTKDRYHDVLRHKLTFYEKLPFDEMQELLTIAKQAVSGERNYIVVADVDPEAKIPRLVIGGNTYPIKDIIKQSAKALGGRAEYRPGLGWLISNIKRADFMAFLKQAGIKVV